MSETTFTAPPTTWRYRLSERTAGADAWGTGTSLEWVASSPPAPHNFDVLPPIRSFAPVWDLHHGGVGHREEGGEPVHGDAEPLPEEVSP